jgi:DHA1 family inner membrane transport protein
MYSVLLASYALNAADRQLFPLLLHDVRDTFHFSLADAGLLSTIFTLGLAVAGLPTGFALARLSRRSVLLMGIAIFSTGTTLTVFSRGFTDLVFYLFATGIGEAMQFTVIVAIAASYFSRNRAAAIGSVNFCFGIGAFSGPVLASLLLSSYQNWHVPMIAFGVAGYCMILVVALTVRPWLSEARSVAHARQNTGGAGTLLNLNSFILILLSVIAGLVLYGFTGLYATFLRESLHYAPKQAGFITGFYGAGALVSLVGGWLGDRFSPRVLLTAAFLGIALVGYLCFNHVGSLVIQVILTAAFGATASGVVFVNLVGYHVKSVRHELASRASGLFVTSFYLAAATAGFLMGQLAGRLGWAHAELIQVSLLSVLGAILALALQPERMCL